MEELEPNDNRDTANPLSVTRCGTLTKRDRIDFLKFRLKPSTKTVSINFTGRVRLRVMVDGKPTTELTPDSAGVIPFVMNEDYIVEVTPLVDVTGEIPWRVELVEK